MTISQKDYGKEFKRALPIYCLFREDISAHAADRARYVMGACDRARSIILWSRMQGTSLVLAALTGLNVN